MSGYKMGSGGPSWNGAPMVGGTMNIFGNVWYVAVHSGSGASDGNRGCDSAKPFSTMAKAIATASAGDTIILGAGTHSIDTSASAMVPKADMQFVAAVPPMGGKPSTIITGDADDLAAMCTIDVDGVGFHGIEFLLVAGATTAVDLFDVAQTTAVNGLVFRDCWFNLNSCDHATAIMRALAIDDATNATTGMVIKNCRFIGGDATTTEAQYIVVGVGGIPDALIEDNVFALESADGTTEGIHFIDPAAAGKSYAMTIRNNDFIGAKDGGGDSVGIVFASAMTDNEILGCIRTNYFPGCADAAITTDESSESCVNNYVPDGSGGALIDVVA